MRFFSGHAPPEDFVEKMTHVAERGGFGLIAVMEEEDGTSRIVGEATYDLLPNGDAELGITVAEKARGWLGPYLLDALVAAAAARGVPNLEADVLVTNRRMLTMLRAWGFAVVEHDPAIVRVAIGTTRRAPSWPGTDERPRLLVEVPGGRWHAEEAARAAGFQVLACPGPMLGWSHCPALRGEPCPLGGRCRRHRRRGSGRSRTIPPGSSPADPPVGAHLRRAPIRRERPRRRRLDDSTRHERRCRRGNLGATGEGCSRPSAQRTDAGSRPMARPTVRGLGVAAKYGDTHAPHDPAKTVSGASSALQGTTASFAVAPSEVVRR